MAGLFRAQVERSQREQYLGSIRLSQEPSSWLLASLAVFFALALVTYVALGEFTRKTTLKGNVVPAHGVLELVSPYAGVLTKLEVTEGQHVEAGSPLAVVVTGRQSTVGPTSQRIAISLADRRRAAMEERDLVGAHVRQKVESLTARIGSIQREIAQAEAELLLVQRRARDAQETLEKYKALANEGFVTSVMAQQRNDEVLELRTRERSAERALTALKRDLQDAKAEISGVEISAQTQRAQLDRSIAMIDQEASSNTALQDVVITAPQAGVVGSIGAWKGQSVAEAQRLVSIVPTAPDGTASPLRVELDAPSQSIGFIREGQEVRIRFAAFPYQKFGFGTGRVVLVSGTPVPRRYTASLAGESAESFYRVVVELKSQIVQAYGKSHPLKPGMAVEADVPHDRRAIWEWIFEPVLAVTHK